MNEKKDPLEGNILLEYLDDYLGYFLDALDQAVLVKKRIETTRAVLCANVAETKHAAKPAKVVDTHNPDGTTKKQVRNYMSKEETQKRVDYLYSVLGHGPLSLKQMYYSLEEAGLSMGEDDKLSLTKIRNVLKRHNTEFVVDSVVKQPGGRGKGMDLWRRITGDDEPISERDKTEE